MKTKLLLIPVLFLLFSVHIFALDRVVDNAGLLKVSERVELTNLMEYIASTYHFDLVIVTEKTIGDASPEKYAYDFYDKNGYGAGTGRDGCIFLRVSGSREYRFGVFGRGNDILNPTAFDKLESDTLKFFDKDNYYPAFRAFVLDWDKFLSLEAKGRSYNSIDRWNLVIMIIVWLFALAIGFLVVHSWKRGMNTAIPQTQAAAYVVSGSLNFTVKTESFLYSNTSKTPRSSGGSGSSSSLSGALRAGSSGMRHGGRGGRR